MAHPLTLPVLGWLRRLSYPRLFMLTAVLFGLNLLVPDPLPLVDELLLGLVTLLLAGRKRHSRSAPTDAASSTDAPHTAD